MGAPPQLACLRAGRSVGRQRIAAASSSSTAFRKTEAAVLERVC